MNFLKNSTYRGWWDQKWCSKINPELRLTHFVARSGDEAAATEHVFVVYERGADVEDGLLRPMEQTDVHRYSLGAAGRVTALGTT